MRQHRGLLPGLDTASSYSFSLYHRSNKHCLLAATQVIKMLVIVVSLFALCWLPLQTYNFLHNVYPDINR